MGDNTMFAFRDASEKNLCIVQEDALDDSTKCSACGMAEMLGYICDMCDKVHCGACLKYDVHSCPQWTAKKEKKYAQSRASQPSNVPSFRACCYKDCGAKSVVPIICKSCSKNFCPRHKLESDHACTSERKQAVPAPSPKPTGNTSKTCNPFAALFLPSSLLKHEDPTTVMVPDLHVDDRYSISVMFTHAYQHNGPKRVVMHKKWGLGKAVDFLLKTFGNKTDEPRHVLVRASDLTKLPTLSSFQELSVSGKLKKTDLLLLLPETWYARAIAQFDAERMAVSNKEVLWQQFYSALPSLVEACG